ncbi:thioredoxin family protein [Bacteroidota bacterium]
MKILQKLLPIILLITATIVNAQEEKKILYYDINADGMEQLDDAVSQAAKENKNIMLVIGGDWCPWCRRLNKYINDSTEVKKFIQDNYVYVKINYSKENKNLPLMKRLELPQRFGFPVIVILDKYGERIHTQDSGLLEKNKSYDPRKLYGFLRNWTISAMDIESYKDYK